MLDKKIFQIDARKIGKNINKNLKNILNALIYKNGLKLFLNKIVKLMELKILLQCWQ